ncbi:MAG: hypothetical protein ACYDDU_00910 [Dermatophilaceae bacterium]
MTVPWHSARQGRGMLLLRGKPDAVSTWARRGLAPVHVVPLEGWTAVLPAGPSRARPPYDDTIKTLAGRHVASRLRSAIGLFAVDGNAVVTVHPTGWRAIPRWFVWSPGQGVARPWHLAPGRPADLLTAAGIRDGGVRRDVRDIFAEVGGDAGGVLGDLLALLSLPGSDLLDGGQDPATASGSALVEPDEHQIVKFERIVSDQALHRAELEED